MQSTAMMMDSFNAHLEEGDLLSAERYLEEIIMQRGEKYAKRHGLFDRLFDARTKLDESTLSLAS